MLEGVSLSTEFLNRCTPLWFTFLMAVTAPYMWSNYAKKGTERAFKRFIGEDAESTDGEQ